MTVRPKAFSNADEGELWAGRTSLLHQPAGIEARPLEERTS